MSCIAEFTRNTSSISMEQDKLAVTTQENQKSSPLLRLPCELRAIMYTYTFLASRVSVAPVVSDTTSSSYRDRDVQRSAVALRQTCLQLRHETREPFFKEVIFDFCVHGIRHGTASDLGKDTYESTGSIHLSDRLGRALSAVSRWPKADQDKYPHNMTRMSLVSLEHVYVGTWKDWNCFGTIDEGSFKELNARILGKSAFDVHTFPSY